MTEPATLAEQGAEIVEEFGTAPGRTDQQALEQVLLTLREFCALTGLNFAVALEASWVRLNERTKH